LQNQIFKLWIVAGFCTAQKLLHRAKLQNKKTCSKATHLIHGLISARNDLKYQLK